MIEETNKHISGNVISLNMDSNHHPLRRHQESCMQSSVKPRGEQRGRRLRVVKRGLSCNLMM